MDGGKNHHRHHHHHHHHHYHRHQRRRHCQRQQQQHLQSTHVCCKPDRPPSPPPPRCLGPCILRPTPSNQTQGHPSMAFPQSSKGPCSPHQALLRLPNSFTHGSKSPRTQKSKARNPKRRRLQKPRNGRRRAHRRSAVGRGFKEAKFTLRLRVLRQRP